MLGPILRELSDKYLKTLSADILFQHKLSIRMIIIGHGCVHKNQLTACMLNKVTNKTYVEYISYEECTMPGLVKGEIYNVLLVIKWSC